MSYRHRFYTRIMLLGNGAQYQSQSQQQRQQQQQEESEHTSELHI